MTFVTGNLTPEQHGERREFERGAAGERPLYMHDCRACTYLGRYDSGGDTYDLYYCPQLGLPTVIARYGDEGHEYTSGMTSDHPALAEARQRAEKSGLV